MSERVADLAPRVDRGGNTLKAGAAAIFLSLMAACGPGEGGGRTEVDDPFAPPATEQPEQWQTPEGNDRPELASPSPDPERPGVPSGPLALQEACSDQRLADLVTQAVDADVPPVCGTDDAGSLAYTFGEELMVVMGITSQPEKAQREASNTEIPPEEMYQNQRAAYWQVDGETWAGCKTMAPVPGTVAWMGKDGIVLEIFVADPRGFSTEPPGPEDIDEILENPPIPNNTLGCGEAPHGRMSDKAIQMADEAMDRVDWASVRPYA